MSYVHAIEPERKNSILKSAIAQKALVGVTFRHGDTWATCKSRLAAELSDCRGLLLQPPLGRDGKPVEGLLRGKRVSISFRRSHKKCLFTSTVEAIREHGYPSDAAGIVLAWPAEVQELQRRAYERAAPPSRRMIQVDFWPANTIVDRGPKPICSGCLQDISAGGMRVIIDPKQMPEWVAGEMVVCRLQPDPRGLPIVVDATFRHCQSEDSDPSSLGFQFLGLESTEAGRRSLQELARITCDFQTKNLKDNKKRHHGSVTGH